MCRTRDEIRTTTFILYKPNDNALNNECQKLQCFFFYKTKFVFNVFFVWIIAIVQSTALSVQKQIQSGTDLI